jgi:hypothetical protein
MILRPFTNVALCAVNCMNSTNYSEIIHHINHRLRGWCDKDGGARFSRRNSIRNAHLLQFRSARWLPYRLTCGLSFDSKLSFPDAAGHLGPLDTTAGASFSPPPQKVPNTPVHTWGAVLFLFYLASFVLLRPGCVDVRDSRQRTLGARRHAPFVCSPAFREARAPHANK